MKKIIASLLLLFTGIHFASAEGIKFEDITLPEALEKAKAENKLVFIDCYVPSCGPCKFMADNVFPLDECGEYFNPRFVSLKKDLEAEPNRYIAKDYNVRIYPTFLILNPDGSVYYKQDGGATRTADKFLDRMKKMMKTGACSARFNSGSREPEFMVDYINNLKGFNNLLLRELLDRYVPSLSVDSLTAQPVWDAVTLNMNSMESPAFASLMERRNALADITGKEELGRRMAIIMETDYNQRRPMLRDFSSRIDIVNRLEEEGLAPATLLVPRMMIRSVINNRLNKPEDVIKAVKLIEESTADESLKIASLKETMGLKSTSTPKSLSKIHSAVSHAIGTLTPAAREELQQVLRTLK